MKLVLVGSKSSSPQFVYLFCPGVKQPFAYTVANSNPLNQLKLLLNASSNPGIYWSRGRINTDINWFH